MRMIDESFANAGAVVAGRAVYDHVHGWGEVPPFRMPVFVPTHRPREIRVAGATTHSITQPTSAPSEANET